MVRVECLSYDALGDQLRRDLVAMRDRQAIYDSPFFDLDFAGILATVRKDTRILVASDDEGVLGYWALHVRPDKWARPIGAPFSDWHGPVMRAEQTSLTPEKFLQLGGLRGMTVTALKPQSLSAQCGGEISACGMVETPDGAGAYRSVMAGLHKKHFKNLRRVERRIEQDFENSALTMDDTSRDAFDWLMSLKQDQYLKTGKHNVLKPDWVRAMMDALRNRSFPRLRGRLSSLRFNGQLAAAEFDILSDKIVHGWITAYDQAYAKYSPGHILMLAVIGDMENTGHVSCDIGADDHAYKTYYETYQQPVERVVLRAGNGRRPLAAAWRVLETRSPDSVNAMLAKMRRRGDQIFSADLSLTGRTSGLIQALLPRKKP